MNDSLAKIQSLVIDITKVKRNHTFPGSDINENVVEHSFSVAILSWRIFNQIKPDLDLEKIFKYSLVHDFLERGLERDVSSYATKEQKIYKEEYEKQAYDNLSEDFPDFEDMLSVIQDYENQADEESKFVKTVDKMQAVILGEINDWRPYRTINITHQQFTEKGDQYMEGCPDCLKEMLEELNQHSRSTFYDQP